MTDLRKAAEMALEVMEYNRANGTPNMGAAIEALRQALAQPEEKMHIEGNGKLTTKPYPDGYESEQQFRKALAQPEWVGLTDEDLKPLCDEWRIMYGGYVDDFAKAIEAKLKEKNT